MVVWVGGVSSRDQAGRVKEDKVVVSKGHQGSWNVDQDGDTRVVFECEDFTTPDDGGKHTWAKITSQVGGDGHGTKADNHGCIGKTESEWSDGW